jgi:transposase InsO family protein
LYLASVLDLGSRRLLGYSMADRADTARIINAVAESWSASLKKELGRRHFATRAEARQAIFVWINYYNHQRLHSACQYRPPVEYEQHLANQPDPEALASPLAA